MIIDDIYNNHSLLKDINYIICYNIVLIDLVIMTIRY